MNIDLSFLNEYNTLDIALVAVLAISVLVGLIRGVVREVLSVAAWAVAIYVALRFAPMVSQQYLKQLIDNDYISYIVSFVSLIIVSLIAVGLVNLLISQLFRVTGLSFANRLLGMVFGGLRGVILGIVAILIIELVPSWTKENWYMQSTLVPHYRKVSNMAMKYLPKELTELLNKQKANPRLKEIKEQVRKLGKDAVVEQLKSEQAAGSSEDVQSLIDFVNNMQLPANNAPNAQQPTRPDENGQTPATSNNPNNGEAQSEGVQLESAQPANTQPEIKLESNQ